MAEAKICDICNRFYKTPGPDKATKIAILRENGCSLMTVDACSECLSAIQNIITNGTPKWLPVDMYDHVMVDWVLVKLRDPGTGEISPLPYIAEMRSDGEWYDRNDDKIIWPVEYFMDLSLVDQIFGGEDLK